MSESLHHRLQRVRRHIRRVLWLYGLSWVIAVVFGAALLVGMLDWAVHLDDTGVRVVLGLLILIGGGWAAVRFLIRPLATRISDVDIALRVESRFPALRDGLSSTVEFIDQGLDPHVGSPNLQRTAIRRTLHTTEQLDITDVIEPRGIRRIAMAAAGICLLVALVAGFNQAAAATALNRLVFPFSAASWPKETQLRLLDEHGKPLGRRPLRLARGDTLMLYVENQKGDLPDDLRLEYRIEDEKEADRPLQIVTRPGRDGHSRQVAVAMLTADQPTLRFRAVGGDDRQMPFRRLEAVPPPLIRDLDVTLTPPAYLRKPVERLADGLGHIRGFVGTRVDVTARANKPLQFAAMRVKDHQPVPVTLSEDGRRLRVSWSIDEAGTYSYWFDLKDRDGFENPEAPRYEVRGIADLLPEVTIETPPTDLNVTAGARVRLRITAKDDLGLREIRLRYKRDGYEEASDSPVVLYTGVDRPRQRTVTHRWQIPAALGEGTRLVFFAEATDDFDLGPPHVKRSLSRTLTIVSAEEKRAELIARQSGLLDDLLRIRKSQQRVADQLGELRVQLETAGRLRRPDIDLLKRLELDQRQIGSRLTNPTDGIAARAARLLAGLTNNHIDDPRMTERLRKIGDEIRVLKAEILPVIDARLTEARKQAEAGSALHPASPVGSSKTTAAPRIETALTSAGEQQRAILESLDEMIRALAQSRDRQSLTNDLNDLIAAQNKLNRDAARVGRETLTRSPAELTPQQRADLARLAERQRKQADRLMRFRRHLQAMAERFGTTDPDRAAPLTEAVEQTKHRATAGRMNEAAGELRQNRIGRAFTLQKQVLDDLNELNRTLQSQPKTETAEERVQKLRKAEHELRSLRNRQQTLLRKLHQARKLSDALARRNELKRLKKRQQQLRGDVASMARQLRRMQAGHSSRSARHAAARMQQAEQALDRNSSDQAAGSQQEALDDLEQAQRELARTRRQTETQFARELLERMADRLKGMIARQQRVIDETGRLDGIHQKTGRWRRSQLKSLRNLVDDQRVLKTETDRLAKTIREAEVFALALSEAARHMHRAADRLAVRQTDAATIEIEQTARQRFVDLVAALKPDTGQAKSKQPPHANPPADGRQPRDGIPQLAQLKMLKTLQEDLLRQTRELDTQRQENGKLNAAQTVELNRLAGVQDRLADLAAELTRQFINSQKVKESKSPTIEK